MGHGGKPGDKRYVNFKKTYNIYVRYDDILRQFIRTECNDCEVTFDLPEGWKLPIAMYLVSDGIIPIGNARGSLNQSETHGQDERQTYKVKRVVSLMGVTTEADHFNTSRFNYKL